MKSLLSMFGIFVLLAGTGCVFREHGHSGGYPEHERYGEHREYQEHPEYREHPRYRDYDHDRYPDYRDR